MVGGKGGLDPTACKPLQQTWTADFALLHFSAVPFVTLATQSAVAANCCAGEVHEMPS